MGSLRQDRTSMKMFQLSTALMLLLTHADSHATEPMTKKELISAWEKRTAEYPNLHVTWKSKFRVNLAEVKLSPFEPVPEIKQAGIKELSSDATDEFWLRGTEMKIRFSELNRHNGIYKIFRKEKNFFQSESWTRIDNVAQGQIANNAEHLELYDHAFAVLKLNFRPVSSALYRKLISGRAHVIPKTKVWAGRIATVVSVPLGPDMLKEYFFDSLMRAHYLGYLSRSPKSESRLEISNQLVNSSNSVVIREANFLESRLPSGNFELGRSYSEYSFEMPAKMPDSDLRIEFDSGFLVFTPGDRPSSKMKSQVVSDDGQLLPISIPSNRKLLDPRVQQPNQRRGKSGLLVPIVAGVGLFVVISVIMLSKFKSNPGRFK